MSQSVLASFDPLATHPFTNNSGLLPKPTPPSKYPHPIPSFNASTQTTGQAGQKPHTTSSTRQNVPLHAPQPSRSNPLNNSRSSPGTHRAPIFVPFRPERSSPDLDDILLKKKVSDVLSNKQTWSIDQINTSPKSSPQKTNTKKGGKQ
ncbi:hypothetical protein ABKN59_003090 [Abortiporus biennis]